MKTTPKLTEMWEALLAYLPQAKSDGHGESWESMCRERKAKSANAAAKDTHAYAVIDAASAAANAAINVSLAAEVNAYAAYAIANNADMDVHITYAAVIHHEDAANMWAQIAIDRMEVITKQEKTT